MHRENEKTLGITRKSKTRWLTFLYTKNFTFKVTSRDLLFAKLKYNMLHSLYKCDNYVPYVIEVNVDEYKRCAEELLVQLTDTTLNRRSKSSQGVPKDVMYSSIYVGVYFAKRVNLYFTYITKEGIRYSLGYYKHERIAAAVYNIGAKHLYGDCARFNAVDMSVIDDALMKRIILKIEKRVAKSGK